ncbi:MAG: NAD(P)H nitroreductase [Clostridiaceae bacterium]|nr:NAD(P)H nitroreductase [Clostridiaceae bacterium]
MMYELIKSRRSIRKFQNKEIEKEKIDTILKCALLSPSSRSLRPWEFVVVTDKKVLHELSKCREHGAKFLADAPLGVVVIADPEKCDVWVEDASIASIIIQLAAHKLGLGSCWIQSRKRTALNGQKTGEYIKELLGIPSKYEVECIIAVGYPDEEKDAYTEAHLLYDKIHYNSF